MKTTIYIAVRGGVVQGVRLGREHRLGRDNRALLILAEIAESEGQ